MKLRYFIPAFIALLGAMLISCSDDDKITLLDEIQVSRSYVAIDKEGGSTSIIVTAKDSWSFDETQIPSWLTISPMSGGAGETEVTFSAEGTINGRNADLNIACAGRKQNIKVLQGLSETKTATCAEVAAGNEGMTYRVTGSVNNIYNLEYGNFYINDGTGNLQIYGTLNKSGKEKGFPIADWGIEEGDIITVEGPLKFYNGAAELEKVTVIKLVKSLLKVESIDPENATIPLEGGDVTVNLTSKGNGVSVEIPEAAKSWLSISNITGGSNPVVTFHAGANAGGDRSAEVTFKTSNGSQESVVTATIKQTGSIVDVNCTQFLEAEEGDTQYRITAVIQSVANTSYGNVYLRDFTDEQVYVFGIGAKGDFQALGLKEGDIVTLVGKRSSHNGNPQMKEAQYESHIPVTDVTIAEFLTKPDNKNVYYRITGEVSSLFDKNGNANDWGNMFITDGSNELYVYGLYPGYGATGDSRKFWVTTAGIEVGDKLTTIGYKDTFGGVVEICGGIYFSHSK